MHRRVQLQIKKKKRTSSRVNEHVPGCLGEAVELHYSVWTPTVKINGTFTSTIQVTEKTHFSSTDTLIYIWNKPGGDGSGLSWLQLQSWRPLWMEIVSHVNNAAAFLSQPAAWKTKRTARLRPAELPQDPSDRDSASSTHQVSQFRKTKLIFPPTLGHN